MMLEEVLQSHAMTPSLNSSTGDHTRASISIRPLGARAFLHLEAGSADMIPRWRQRSSSRAWNFSSSTFAVPNSRRRTRIYSVYEVILVSKGWLDDEYQDGPPGTIIWKMGSTSWSHLLGETYGIGAELSSTADGSNMGTLCRNQTIVDNYIHDTKMGMTNEIVNAESQSECAHHCECHSFGRHDFWFRDDESWLIHTVRDVWPCHSYCLYNRFHPPVDISRWMLL
jgi:hypothetical protein